MKFKVIVVLLVVAMAWVWGRSNNHEANAAVVTQGQKEIRQTFQLTAGAQVEVRGINGSVDIETSDSNTAELHIIRTAKDSSDLDRQQIIVEQTPTSLNIYGKKTEGSWRAMFGGGNVHNRVMLKLPRRVELTTKGVNGPVVVGELDGAVRLSGINGRVEVAQSANFAEVSGINGGVTIGVTRLGPDGLTVKGVNGGVEIRLAQDLNADIDVRGLNGSVSLNIPNVTTQERNRSSLQAQIGTGGIPINIKGVNGGVRFVTANATR